MKGEILDIETVEELAENKNVAAALAQESNIDNGLFLVETVRKQNKNKKNQQI